MTAALLLGQTAPPADEEPSDAESQEESTPQQTDPRYGLLTPIPECGGLPPIYSKLYEHTPEELRQRAAVRDYAKQLRAIRQKHFGKIKKQEIRDAGFEQLREFTDPATFEPMITELAEEKDDVRLWMLDHFVANGAEGQAALAKVAIHDKNYAIANEALRRMTQPVDQPALYVVEKALRSKDAAAANSASILVNTLNIVQAVPLLIFAQATGNASTQPPGDLAWIAFETQHAYIAGLTPLVGNNAGAFQPIIGVVSEGTVMRVVDAVVIEYRTVVHHSLVNLTSADWGESTESMGYNIRAWWDWYNNTYVPFKQKQAQQS